jgi:1,4-dihydroxy-6-naphthoate synthase
MGESYLRGPLRVAISPCPNDTFAFGNLILGQVKGLPFELDFEFHDIEALNALGVSEAAPDVLKFSFAHYGMLSEHYRLLKVGAALGLGVGPLLVGVGELPLSKIKRIYVPGRQTTANLLFQRFGRSECGDAEVVELRYDLIMQRCAEEPESAGVIIHESRFTYEFNGLKALLDLGAAWEHSTKLPLPLGGIAMHRRCSEEVALAFEVALGASLDAAWEDRSNLLPMMRSHAQEMDDKVMGDHIGLYVNQYTRELGSEGQKAVEELCSRKLEFASAVDS